jgi:hypothetical protein
MSETEYEWLHTSDLSFFIRIDFEDDGMVAGTMFTNDGELICTTEILNIRPIGVINECNKY